MVAYKEPTDKFQVTTVMQNGDLETEFKPTEEGFECSVCGNHNPDTCDVVRRTCGYLGNPLARPMIHGRHEEIKSRVKHT